MDAERSCVCVVVGCRIGLRILLWNERERELKERRVARLRYMSRVSEERRPERVHLNNIPEIGNPHLHDPAHRRRRELMGVLATPMISNPFRSLSECVV